MLGQLFFVTLKINLVDVYYKSITVYQACYLVSWPNMIHILSYNKFYFSLRMAFTSLVPSVLMLILLGKIEDSVKIPG